MLKGKKKKKTTLSYINTFAVFQNTTENFKKGDLFTSIHIRIEL